MIWAAIGIFESEGAFITACTQIFCFILLEILTWNLYGRYKQHPNVALRYLMLTTLFLGLASILQLLDQVFFQPFFAIDNIGYGLAFGVSAIGNIFMAFFIWEIFMSGRASGGVKLTIFIIGEAVVAILSPILNPIFPAQLPSLIVLMIHLLFSIILYVTFIRVTTNSIRKTSDAITRKGFGFLRAAGVTIICAYTGFILDNVAGTGYTIWVILGWLFAAVTGILLYQGFVYPTKARAQTETAAKV